MTIGAQLYTVREHTKTLSDFSQTLKKIADIGYTTVQVSGTCDFSPEWLADELKSTGLKCVLTHTKPDKLLEDAGQVAAEHKVFGCRYVGLGSMPGAKPDLAGAYGNFVKNFMPVAKTIADSGLYFMYHNHAFEFTKSECGKTYLDLMASAFPAEILGFTLDTYWVQAGGGDPAFWIRKLAGRVPCVHLKDMAFTDGNIKMAPVGHGNMNFPAILSACHDAETEFLLVEQDHTYGEDSFDCLKKSYDYLKSHGLN